MAASGGGRAGPCCIPGQSQPDTTQGGGARPEAEAKRSACCEKQGRGAASSSPIVGPRQLSPPRARRDWGASERPVGSNPGSRPVLFAAGRGARRRSVGAAVVSWSRRVGGRKGPPETAFLGKGGLSSSASCLPSWLPRGRDPCPVQGPPPRALIGREAWPRGPPPAPPPSPQRQPAGPGLFSKRPTASRLCLSSGRLLVLMTC